ncbi:MAG TPA: MBL fold metallo-hydrolase [Dehalococcoidia bacterium]|nr:MBL fold metallo-hydrolase [Dehalococcoidia bacterium]
MTQQAPLDLAFLGSGNALAPERCWSGFLLNGRYLFDTPPTALLSLKRLGANLAGIDTILLSHFHSDHFFGLPFLFLEYAHRTQRRSDLTIVGPPGVEERVQRLMEIGNPTTLQHESGYRLRYVEVADGADGEVNGLRFNTVQMEHGGGIMECFGFQTSASGRRLAYTGDTGWCDGLLRLGDDVEVLVSDCTYTSGRNHPDGHLSLEEIAGLRPQLDPRTAIVLTHLGGPTSPAGLRRTFVASDLARFSFP